MYELGKKDEYGNSTYSTTTRGTWNDNRNKLVKKIQNEERAKKEAQAQVRRQAISNAVDSVKKNVVSGAKTVLKPIKKKAGEIKDSVE